jgi:hypothetical protein
MFLCRKDPLQENNNGEDSVLHIELLHSPLKVHKHEISFYTFFAETETIWSQGPVTRDFWKSNSIRPRYSYFKHFRACSACDEIRSAYAQCAIKFVSRMLSMDCTCKTVHIFRWLSIRENSFLVCSVCDEIGSAYAQHAIKSFPCMLSIRML